MRRSGNPRTTASIADGFSTNRLNPSNLRASDREAVDDFRCGGRLSSSSVRRLCAEARRSNGAVGAAFSQCQSLRYQAAFKGTIRAPRRQAVVQPSQAPDIVGVDLRPAQTTAQSEVFAIHRFGFIGAAPFEQKRAERWPTTFPNPSAAFPRIEAHE